MAALSVALESYPHTVALKNGAVKPTGVELDFAEVPGSIMTAFRRMARDLAYDVSELGISTALGAKEYGLPFTAIPVFVTRRFDHEAMYFNVSSGITEPKDLEGKRVGVRSYTVTDVVWSCGVLIDTHHVDLSKIHWVVTADEHVGETVLPGNAETLPGGDLEAMIESGDLDAIINPYRGSSDAVRPLISDHVQAEREWAQQKGFIPMHHTIVVKDSVLAENPDVANSLYRALTEAKQHFLSRLDEGGPLSESEQRIAANRDLMGPDPLPYGIEANREALECVVRYAYDHRLVSRPMKVEEFFVAVDES